VITANAVGRHLLFFAFSANNTAPRMFTLARSLRGRFRLAPPSQLAFAAWAPTTCAMRGTAPCHAPYRGPAFYSEDDAADDAEPAAAASKPRAPRAAKVGGPKKVAPHSARAKVIAALCDDDPVLTPIVLSRQHLTAAVLAHADELTAAIAAKGNRSQALHRLRVFGIVQRAQAAIVASTAQALADAVQQHRDVLSASGRVDRRVVRKRQAALRSVSASDAAGLLATEARGVPPPAGKIKAPKKRGRQHAAVIKGIVHTDEVIARTF
jgi:hypothetical protein